MTRFPARAAIQDVPLRAFGFQVDVPGVGSRVPDLTVAQALELAEVVAHSGQLDGWQAQAEVLDRFPGLLGLGDVTPSAAFAAAQLFAQEVYALLYGLAESFFGHLVSTPGAQVMRMAGTTEVWSSTPGSTT